jgi:hypothetical protein
MGFPSSISTVSGHETAQNRQTTGCELLTTYLYAAVGMTAFSHLRCRGSRGIGIAIDEPDPAVYLAATTAGAMR